MPELQWTKHDSHAVDTARILAADAVQKAGNGHPGTAISLAPVAYLLYRHLMVHDPTDPGWMGRDRFVLSCGHSSLTQYIQLFLNGYGLELKDLQQLRQWGSLTPGHPEVGHTPGVEITTGPLGSGLASAVGMAMAARRERGLFDPDTAAGESIFDHTIYVLASDGDIQEGVSSEASSIAGTQQLGNLVVIWDDNQISIEGGTSIALSEDVSARYAAYGWHVQHVDFTSGETYNEDIPALAEALEAAKNDPRPSFIRLSTIIAWPSPMAQNTGGAHGAALGEGEVAALKKVCGFDPARKFAIAPEVLAHTRLSRDIGKQAHAEWNTRFEAWAEKNPERAQLLQRLQTGELPPLCTLEFDADAKGIATRSASGKVINALAPDLPELWGGSCDLAGSNNTIISRDESFLPPEHSSAEFTGSFFGRNLHFGVREFAAGLICNGIALHGNTRPYCATFLVFSDYQRPAIRLAALQQLPTIFIWTHDSIGLGEDGPTHQPVEHLSSLRAIPRFDVIRPADANEVSVVWKKIVENRSNPSGLVLTRQATPILDRNTVAPAAEAARGGYILWDSQPESASAPDVLVMATGSEVAIAYNAAQTLAETYHIRVVSLPCHEWFEQQPQSYRDEVLPPQVLARVSVEAGAAQSWYRYLGGYGVAVSVEDFGASAPYQVLYEKYGITPQAVIDAAEESLRAVAYRGDTRKDRYEH